MASWTISGKALFELLNIPHVCHVGGYYFLRVMQLAMKPSPQPLKSFPKAQGAAPLEARAATCPDCACVISLGEAEAPEEKEEKEEVKEEKRTHDDS